MSAAPSINPRRQGSAKPVWSDGIHFVRAASPSDRHAMRWVVGPHKKTGASYRRHAENEAAAIDAAKAATDAFLRETPSAAHFHFYSTASEPGDNSGTPLSTAASPSATVAGKARPFSTTLFDCVYANPVAQVWMMTREPGEHKPVGRRKAGGQPATQTVMPHEKGQCAVLLIDRPVRTLDGQVRVYHSQGEAEEAAATFYEEAPEEDTISWRPGHVRVASSLDVEVHFNPEVYGVPKPFVLWLPRHQRCVFVDRTRPTISRHGVGIGKLSETDPQLALEAKAARARAAKEDRQPSFEDQPLRFKSIGAALAEADRRERMLRGETVRNHN